MLNIQNPFANMTPVVKNLVMINVVFYVCSYLLVHAGIFDADRWLAAYYPAAPDFWLWQIITYMFMHAPFSMDHPSNLLHILFNMFALASIGPIVENTVGAKRFLILYLICGVGAFASQVVVNAFQVHAITGNFFTTYSGLENSALQYSQAQLIKLVVIYKIGLVGASGSVFGVVTAFGFLYPDLELMVMPIPVPIKAKYLVPGYIALELILSLMHIAGDDVAHAAHIGGALVGFIIIKLWGIRRGNNFY